MSPESLRRLRALTRKEFLQLWRDRRTILLMTGMPLILLLIFGYGIHLEVKGISAELVSKDSVAVRQVLSQGGRFAVQAAVAPDVGRAHDDLLHGRTSVALVVGASGTPTRVLIDGSDVYTAQNTLQSLRALSQSLSRTPIAVDMLFNASIRSADFMVPAEVGMIMLWVGTLATALGVVRERERGTLEQLLMTPLRRAEIMVGKIIPSAIVTLCVAVVITFLGTVLFHVPLRGSPLLLLLFAVPYLISALALGLLLSTIAQNQRQAMQSVAFTLMPQILLSGTLFPLRSIPWGIRWVSQMLPLTYFTPITRGIFLKGLGFGDLWPNAAVLTGMAVVVTTAAALAFRGRLD